MSLKVGLSRVKIKLNGHVAKLKLATCAPIFLAHLKMYGPEFFSGTIFNYSFQ